MAKILVTAENFAFGPVSKLVTVAEELIKRGHELTFIGEGTAYQLGSKVRFKKIYRFDTDSKEFIEWGEKIFKKADVVLTSGDRSSVILCQKLNIPIIWLDILFWWWDEIPKFLWNVDLYIQQNSLDNKRNSLRYKNKIKNMKVVGPIIDLGYKNSRVKKQLLLGFGGMEAKGWYKIGKDSTYPYTIAKLIMKMVDVGKYEKVLFVGNERITNDLSKKFGNKKFVFKMLPHKEFLKEMAESEDVLIIPGLETPLEAFAYEKPILFLPPSNSSHYVELDEFRKLHLANKINSLHFADYYPYRNLAGGNLRKIMEIFLKELKKFENSPEILEDCAKRINRYLNLTQKTKNKQKLYQRKFMSKLGKNGLKETINLIESFIEKNKLAAN